MPTSTEECVTQEENNVIIVTQERNHIIIVTQERNHITSAFPTGCIKHGKSLPVVYVSAIDILWIIIASNIKTFEFWRVRKKKKVRHIVPRYLHEHYQCRTMNWKTVYPYVEYRNIVLFQMIFKSLTLSDIKTFFSDSFTEYDNIKIKIDIIFFFQELIG